MHHGKDLSDDLREQAQQQGLGATGQFPEGKLTETDEGEIRIAVGVHSGKVVVNFGKPVAWFALDSKQARELAESLRKMSYKAGS